VRARRVSNLQENAEELYETVRQAMYALQLICPCGCKNIYLKFHKTPDGYDQIGYCGPQNLKSTLMGRIVLSKHARLDDDFEPVYSGISRAFSEKIVKLQNPILLLEQGMQTGNPHLAVLMCVMGLDVLFMAGGEKSLFVKRIGGFLGRDSFVFPPVLSYDLQPSVKVQDVLDDVYEFRNRIAHGLEIPEHPYREKYELLSTTGGRLTYDDYYYAELMLDSSIFLLCTALRKIFFENFYDDVRDVKRWRAKMTIFEHRFKDGGGIFAESRQTR
jgi:hypothetical protein